MLEYGTQRSIELTRQGISALAESRSAAEQAIRDARGSYETRCAQIVSLIDGMGRDQIKALYVRRYAMVEVDAVENGRPAHYEPVRLAAQSAAIINDLTEIVQSGLTRVVAEKLGSLFSLPGAAWSYVDSATAATETLPEVAKVIEGHRTAGQGWAALVRADRVASVVGVGYLRLHWSASGIRYHAVSPQHVALIYGDAVYTDGQPEPVPIDQRDVEDASAVIIRETDPDSSGRCVYEAWIGRSETDPDGRYLRYTAGTDWQVIPDKGSASIVSEEPDGNPLTLAQRKLSADIIPCEYPLVALLGSYTDALSQMPADDLYCADLDYSLAISRCLTASVTNAGGTKWLANDNNMPLPHSLEGCVAGMQGQSLTFLSIPSAQARDALDVVLSTVRHTLASRGIPADEIRLDVAAAPESGTAILLRSAPLELARQQRATINRTAVERLFAIERELIELYGSTKIPATVVQLWTPGSFAPPVDRDALVTRLTAAMTAGIIDQVDAIREYHGLDEDAAKDKAESMRKAKAEREPAPAATPVSRFGLTPRASRKQTQTDEG